MTQVQLPLDSYISNYEAILCDKPLIYGNMKGLTLNKDKFFRDHSDYEVLMRKEIPSKYKKYFSKVADNVDEEENEYSEGNSDNESFEIEFGRGLQLSPKKNWHQDAQKEGMLNLDLKGKKVDFNSNTIGYKKLTTIDTPDEDKYVTESARRLVKENKALKNSIDGLRHQISALKDINKDQKKIFEITRNKLIRYKSLYQEKIDAEVEAQVDVEIEDEKPSPGENEDMANFYNDIPQLKDIDVNINELKLQKESLINEYKKRKLSNQTVVNLNISSELSDKLIKALALVNGSASFEEAKMKMKSSPSSNSTPISTPTSTSTTPNSADNCQHKNLSKELCSFCTVSSEDSILDSLNMNVSQFQELMKHLKEYVQNKSDSQVW
ncbi:hypothetical protein DAMA08_000270 [Martiniozyma asiatica (nom. inval.)]|nr:hypothetical protein DAMA08_000270 [Martiniozyma asiatica]